MMFNENKIFVEAKKLHFTFFQFSFILQKESRLPLLSGVLQAVGHCWRCAPTDRRPPHQRRQASLAWKWRQRFDGKSRTQGMQQWSLTQSRAGRKSTRRMTMKKYPFRGAMNAVQASFVAGDIKGLLSSPTRLSQCYGEDLHEHLVHHQLLWNTSWRTEKELIDRLLRTVMTCLVGRQPLGLHSSLILSHMNKRILWGTCGCSSKAPKITSWSPKAVVPNPDRFQTWSVGHLVPSHKEKKSNSRF